MAKVERVHQLWNKPNRRYIKKKPWQFIFVWRWKISRQFIVPLLIFCCTVCWTKNFRHVITYFFSFFLLFLHKQPWNRVGIAKALPSTTVKTSRLFCRLCKFSGSTPKNKTSSSASWLPVLYYIFVLLLSDNIRFYLLCGTILTVTTDRLYSHLNGWKL